MAEGRKVFAFVANGGRATGLLVGRRQTECIVSLFSFLLSSSSPCWSARSPRADRGVASAVRHWNFDFPPLHLDYPLNQRAVKSERTTEQQEHVQFSKKNCQGFDAPTSPPTPDIAPRSSQIIYQMMVPFAFAHVVFALKSSSR